MTPDYKQIVSACVRRDYGQAWKTVRQFAKGRIAPFSPEDLPLERSIAVSACSQLHRRGELSRVTPPKYGRGGYSATYVLGNGQRPILTKKRLDLELFGKPKAQLNPDELRAYWRAHKKLSFAKNAESIRRSCRESYRRSRARLSAQGLTSRGTPRKYFIVGQPKTRQEVEWRQFRASITIDRPEFLSPLER